MPPEITKLTEKFLQAPVRVEVCESHPRPARNITQRLVKSEAPRAWDKRETLRRT
jgi:superfamily II DNA/RNA helicase